MADDFQVHFSQTEYGPLEDYAETLAFPSPEAGGLFEKVMKLPEKYRTAIYLYYYEDYSTDEIARLTGTPAATVRTRLRRGRELLRAGLEEAKSNV